MNDVNDSAVLILIERPFYCFVPLFLAQREGGREGGRERERERERESKSKMFALFA